MNCAEFQKVLPDIIDAGATGEEEAHLKSCPVCSDLVADLKYIAEQAKLLVPMVDPSPQVWNGIQTSLEREGLVRPASGTRRFPGPVEVPSRGWSPGSLVAVAAAILIALGVFSYRSSHNKQQPAETVSTSAPAATTAGVDDDDTNLLQQVSQQPPAVQATYQESLNSVNQYIADARNALRQDPTDEEAHAHLIAASHQKAMLYEMALSRSLR